MNSSPPVQPSEERQMFEQWADSMPGRLRRTVNDDGDSPLGQYLWEAWQARAALSASNEDVRDARQLRDLIEALENEAISYGGSSPSYEPAARAKLKAARDAVDKALAAH